MDGWKKINKDAYRNETTQQIVFLDGGPHALQIIVSDKKTELSIPFKLVAELLSSEGYVVLDPPCQNWEARVKCDCSDCVSRKFENFDFG